MRTHAKYVLVKGAVGGDRPRHIVWTGSQNWVAGSLSRGDETTLNIALRSAWSDYMRTGTRSATTRAACPTTADGPGVSTSSDDLPPRVVLHVGTPKSGTTFLQRALWRTATSWTRPG